jgi:hypothetical protein
MNVVEVSDKDSDRWSPSRKSIHGSNSKLCSYALKGVEKDEDESGLEEGELEEGEIEDSNGSGAASGKGMPGALRNDFEATGGKGTPQSSARAAAGDVSMPTFEQ